MSFLIINLSLTFRQNTAKLYILSQSSLVRLKRVAIMAENYHTLTLEESAKIVNVSKWHFCRIFKQL
jgi:AraC-like DNA-binding protein